MKNILLIACLSVTNLVSAQTQLSDFYDAGSSNRPEFSYNVVVKIQKNEGETSDAKRFTVVLVQAAPDTKGFFNPADKNFYSCGQLGNVCNPNNLYLISAQIFYNCNGQKKVSTAVFRNLNEQKFLSVVLGAGGKFCESFDFYELKVVGAALDPTHLGQIQDKIKQLGKPNNTQNNATNKNPSSPESLETKKTETNTVPGQIPDSYTGNPLHYNNPNTTSTKSNFEKGLETGQQIVDIAIGVIDLFGPSKAALQRRDQESRKKEEEIRETEKKREQESIDQVRRAALYESTFKRDINKYLTGANNGDMILKMKLLFEKAIKERRGNIDLSHLLPDWKQWLIDAANNNYFDAINLIGTYSLYYHPSPIDFTLEEGVNMLKKSADLGNVESMLMLADYYDQEKEYSNGGGDSEKALYWYKAAAKKGSQYAMYSLGNIYRYDNATGLSHRVKYNIANNDTALIYFKKASNNPPLLSSSFYDNFGYELTKSESERTTTDAYRQLSIMYSNGLGCEKDIAKAEEYKKLSDYPIGVNISDAWDLYLKDEYTACIKKLDEIDRLLLKNNKTGYLRILCLDKMYQNGNIEDLEELKTLADKFTLQYQAMDKDKEYHEVNEIAQRINPERIYNSVDVMPEFPGGQAGLSKHISSNIKFPKGTLNNNISGKVFVWFVVDKKGSVKDITVLKGLGKAFDEEAVRVFRIMPLWTPGYQNGKPVNVEFTIPLNFTSN